MKTKLFYLSMVLVLTGLAPVFGQTNTETFKVFGNCELCETRIETAATSIVGVTVADWNAETKNITVTYDDTKTDLHKIHSAIASVGHDTNMHRAENKVYEALPACCRYKRAPLSSNDSGNGNM